MTAVAPIPCYCVILLLEIAFCLCFLVRLSCSFILMLHSECWGDLCDSHLALCSTGDLNLGLSLMLGDLSTHGATSLLLFVFLRRWGD